ncbi:MAG TPA: UDP-glucose/GDP-mannose dehydrogenase family protein [Myxococcales bacterium LLY-WYZ-16_1]|jgi:UDPglucose 6-dehydrogenase|nr:UDP-glucose/GDP-mannose dehydrogenase family protein [Myxococcales bacterium LLY-WYZ-16_1]
MELAVIGTGYVGLVAGTCFAEMGHDVVCVDKSEEKIRILQSGGIPIYEPRLRELIAHNVEKKRLAFSTDLASSVERSEVVFIAVGTPMAEDGRADLSMVMGVAKEIGQAMKRPLIVCTKSTVPVGTALRIRQAIAEITDIPADVVSNPEFMKEGAAVDDFMKPDRIILGTDSEHAREVMTDIYAPFNRTTNRMIFMDTASAEMTKYVSNAMLATRISFMNEMAGLCERLGADVMKVRLGVGADPRIGPSFLFPGVGFGGSCFPKDIRALRKMGEDAGYPLQVLTAVDDVNDRQKHVLLDKIVANYGDDLSQCTFGVWGLAFKPQTDDMRQAPSVRIIEGLLERGAKVRATDPEAMNTARAAFSDRIELVEDQYEALRGADALVLVTEWNEFRRPDFKRIRQMLRKPVVFDGRNVFNPDRMRAMGYEYHCIGRA